MSFLDRIREANRCDPSRFRPFRVAGRRVGYIRDGFAAALARWPDAFRVTASEVTLAHALDRADVALDARSAAVHDVVLQLREQGLTGPHWYDEPYAVNRHYGEPPVLLLERGAVQPFGVCAYGIHVNGFVRAADGLRMWVGRRALDRPSGPGKLDQLVAGGQPAAIGLADNVVKESAEEAAIPAELARRAVPVGAVTYCLETDFGLRPDVIFNYDLELPEDFVPVNADGEVQEFYLWPVEQVMAIVRDGTEFKFNCALVVIDFLIRHGVLPPEHPDYIELLHGLRLREQILTHFADISDWVA